MNLFRRSQTGYQSETKKTVDYPKGLKPYTNTARRRTGISAEVEDQTADTWEKTVVPKTAEQLERIKQATAKSFLFAPLDDTQKNDIYDCMEEVKFKAGEFVIKQFTDGDYFYVIDSGKFEVFEASQRPPPEPEEGEEESEEEKQKRAELWPGRKLVTLDKGGSFGEIALMYNTPRTASVQAVTDAVLFRLERSAFRHVVVRHAARERKDREARLRAIPLLNSMTESETSQIADILVSKKYKEGEYVLRHGEEGSSMFLVMEGEGVATHFIKGKEVPLRTLKRGDYFGEHAIITKGKRSANVKATTTPFTVDSIDRATVERLFGNIRALMKSRMEKEYSYIDHIVEEETVHTEEGAAKDGASPVKAEANEDAHDPQPSSS